MLKFLTEGVILSNILFSRPVPNPPVCYGKVYNSYVRERGKVIRNELIYDSGGFCLCHKVQALYMF